MFMPHEGILILETAALLRDEVIAELQVLNDGSSSREGRKGKWIPCVAPSGPDWHPEVRVHAGRPGREKNLPPALLRRGEVELQELFDASAGTFSPA